MEDKQTGSVEQQRGTDEGPKAPPRPLRLEAEHAEQPRPDPNVGEARGSEEQPPPPPTRWTRFSSWFNPEHMNVFLTAVIAITGVVGIILVIQSGKDTERMIRAAEQQANAASDQADAAQQFSDTADEISSEIGDAVGKLDAQARATERSANAAKSAAQTAKETLHLSERAYIAFGAPKMDYTKKTITLEWINTGHIPSGPMEIIAHEATFNLATTGGYFAF